MTASIILLLLALILFGHWQVRFIEAHFAFVNGPSREERQARAVADPWRYIKETISTLARPSLYVTRSPDRAVEAWRRRTLLAFAIFLFSSVVWLIDSLIVGTTPNPVAFDILTIGILVGWIITLVVEYLRRDLMAFGIAVIGLLASMGVAYVSQWPLG